MQLAGGVLFLVGAVWLWGPWALVVVGLFLLLAPEVPGVVRAIREVGVNDDSAAEGGSKSEPVRRVA